MTNELRLHHAQDVDAEWIAAGFYRMAGTPDGAIYVDIGKNRYRCVMWSGATHYSVGNHPGNRQCYISREDFARNEWIEVRP